MMYYSDEMVEAIEKIMPIQDAEKNEEQTLAYNSLISSFSINGIHEYPSNYGGAYIDDEQNLVIYDSSSESNQTIYAQRSGLEAVRIKIADYSITYLNSLMDIINNYIMINDQETNSKNELLIHEPLLANPRVKKFYQHHLIVSKESL